MAAPDSPESLDGKRLVRVHTALLDWFAIHASDLPWRRDPQPYAVLVSEFMLQQTQRERVVAKFIEFLERFPSLEALAEAPASAAIRAWHGLGYNARALRLHRTARALIAAGGEFPRDVEGLRRLPGIGTYTAGAIACFGFGEQTAFVDTNIRRVLRRVFWGDLHPEPSAKRDEWLAASALAPGRAVEWNSALMDLGALICKASVPRCRECPLRRDCLAAPKFLSEIPGESTRTRVAEPASSYWTARDEPATLAVRPFKSTDRYLRGRLIDALRNLSDGEAISLEALACAVTGAGLPPDEERTSRLIATLEREGMAVSVEVDGERQFRLPD